MTHHSPQRSRLAVSRHHALTLMVAYGAIVSAPLVIVTVARLVTDHGLVYTLGKNLALVGFAIFALQFVLSARLPWIERPFGLNVLFQFHKVMAVIASLLVLSHPLLLIAGDGSPGLMLGPDVTWDIWLGRVALAVILFSVLLSGFRAVIRLQYETWRWIHNVVGLVFLPLAFLHAWNAGGDLQLPAMRIFFATLFVAAMVAYAWHRGARPALLGRAPYRVSEVRRETERVWTITLAAPAGAPRFDFVPGQFHFVTLRRAAHLPVEEHHWTIASSPTEPGILRTTIKESGDFTATVGETLVGDTAVVFGPFGRFSYALHRDEGELVFVAGGIGITPLMSMLRHIRDSGAQRTVTLLYANRAEQDIVFREELATMEATGVASLKVIHVLSDPPANWSGQRGHIDRDVLVMACGPNLDRKAFYVCAPVPLLRRVTGVLVALGVAHARIHFERFSL